jgi:hypothetical protein
VYTSLLLVSKNGELRFELQMHIGGDCERKILHWHHREHYELRLIVSD